MNKENYTEWLDFNFVDEPVESSERFLKQAKKRRSIRFFSDKKVDLEAVRNAIRTAGTAPSGANRQPWHFVMVTNKVEKRRLRQAAERVEQKFYHKVAPKSWLEALKPFGTSWEKPYLENAPAIILIFSKTRNTEKDGEATKNYYPIESVGIATGFLIMALHQIGLGTLTHTPQPMKFFNEFANLPKNYKPFMLLAVGYPEEPIMVPKISRKKDEEFISEI